MVTRTEFIETVKKNWETLGYTKGSFYAKDGDWFDGVWEEFEDAPLCACAVGAYYFDPKIGHDTRENQLTNGWEALSSVIEFNDIDTITELSDNANSKKEAIEALAKWAAQDPDAEVTLFDL